VKTKKQIAILCIIFCLLFSYITYANASTTTERLWGSDRYRTAVAISNAGWPFGASDIVLATGEDYPDALCAAPIAKILNAPILLTNTTTLNVDTENEIARLGAKKIYIVGGPGVITEEVKNKLEAKGLSCVRMWGNDRFTTSLAAAKFIEEKTKSIEEIFLVVGDDYPDALSVSPIAAQRLTPIILVPKDILPDSINEFIGKRQIKRTFVIGGNDVISDAVVSQLPNSERILGSDKYERNIAILNKFSSDIKLDKVYIATGDDYPDALSGSVLAQKTGAPIILTAQNPSQCTKGYLNSKGSIINKIVALGGEGVITQSAFDVIQFTIDNINATAGGLDVHTQYNEIILPIQNGGFEEGLKGWKPLWTREDNVGKASIDDKIYKNGQKSLRTDFAGNEDWGFSPQSAKIDVNEGEVYELQSWMKAKGEGHYVLGAIAYDSSGKVIDWGYGKTVVHEGTGDWQFVKTIFLITQNIAKIEPRLAGNRPLTLWIDDFSIKRLDFGYKDKLKDAYISNGIISIVLNASTGALSVTDERIGKTWQQQSYSKDFIVVKTESNKDEIRLELFNFMSEEKMKMILRLHNASPEYSIELIGDGDMPKSIQYPQPFVTDTGTSLIIPMNEGISYPVDDMDISDMRLVAYGGHGICMSFWGVTDGNAGHMAIIETPDDAAISILRINGKLSVVPEWDSQKGKFAYTRKLRYVFFDQGGFVAIAKRYREYSKVKGQFKTLNEKRQENPNVDLLIGAANVWCWDEKNSVSIAQDMQTAGISKILWSNGRTPDNIREMNNMGVLTSRSDIYQDVMDPGNFKYFKGINNDWPTEAWPKDVMLDAFGNIIKNWKVQGKDGKWYDCGVLCDKKAVDYAAKRISEELKNRPYEARFIDTTTASPWRECYSPDHPLTRTESRELKMKLLNYVSKDSGLVTGSETGHDAAVPYLHYFEGMMSIAPYRIPDYARNMQKILDEAPEKLLKYQVGYKYRLPLWELVYHDCIVSYWYYGDYNNKIPSIWDKRDLLNVLYGTPPMYMFNKKYWEDNKDRFVESYNTVGQVARDTGYSEMLDFKILKDDKSVQQSVFANGISVTVNFGDNPFYLPDGREVTPMGYCISIP